MRDDDQIAAIERVPASVGEEEDLNIETEGGSENTENNNNE
jgi:hypothetical protein